MPLAPNDPLHHDIEAVQRLPAVPTILRVITETTGLRYSLVARTTDQQWVACAVNDQVNFGLGVGGTLELATTLCRQVRATAAPVVMDHASIDPIYRDHPTPKLYNFESYIAVPIFLEEGQQFGSLCALDPLPAKVNQPRVLSMMRLFADLISMQLSADSRLQSTATRLQDAEKANRELDRFAYTASHDLKAPLRGITNLATYLEDDLSAHLTDESREHLRMLRQRVMQMHALVDGVLRYSRAGHGSEEARPVQVRELLDSVISLLAAPATTTFEIAPMPTLLTTPLALQQVFQNLIGNALKHGGPNVTITIGARAVGERWAFSVADDGPGIPVEEQQKVWELFASGKRAATDDSGIGLSIVKRTVEAVGGAVWLESMPGKGATFFFTWPK